MTDTEFDPHTLLAESRIGVLATIKSDGLPQLSPKAGMSVVNATTVVSRPESTPICTAGTARTSRTSIPFNVCLRAWRVAAPSSMFGQAKSRGRP